MAFTVRAIYLASNYVLMLNSGSIDLVDDEAVLYTQRQVKAPYNTNWRYYKLVKSALLLK